MTLTSQTPCLNLSVFFPPVFMPQSILFTMTWTMKMELSLCMEVLSDKIIKVCNYAIFFRDKFQLDWKL